MEREKGKELNRAKIRHAAEAIIRNEGMANLTMRRLADDAGVSIATPYNLFGSKVYVLLSIMLTKQMEFRFTSSAPNGKPALELMMQSLDSLGDFIGRDEEFFRSIQREIMIAEDTAAPRGGFLQVTVVLSEFITEAKNNGELQGSVDVADLSRYLATIMFGVQGMWASSFFSNEEAMAHIRRSWIAVLEQNKAKPEVS